jgi:hypothetical protein
MMKLFFNYRKLDIYTIDQHICANNIKQDDRAISSPPFLLLLVTEQADGRMYMS